MHARRRTIKRQLACLVVAAASCTPAAHRAADRQPAVTTQHVDGVELGTDVGHQFQLPDDVRGALAAFRSTVPEHPASRAVIQFRRTWRLVPKGPTDPTDRLFLSNLGPTAQDVRVICVEDGRGIPCTSDREVIEVSLGTMSAALVDLRLAGSTRTSSLTLLLVAHDDVDRLPPLTASLPVRIGVARSATHRLDSHPAVTAGCDLALLTETSRFTASYTPPVHVSHLSDLYLVVSTCEPTDDLLQILAIGDEHVVLRLPPELRGLLRLHGRTAVLPLRDLAATWPEICRIQFVVLRHEGPAREEHLGTTAVDLCDSVRVVTGG